LIYAREKSAKIFITAKMDIDALKKAVRYAIEKKS
jgi:NRPS condensation-like uncharacterized protein